MDKTEAWKLFTDYTYYRRQTANYTQAKAKHPIRDYLPKPERLQIFEDMLVWCREKMIDPRLWLFHLFEVRLWTFAPPLTPVRRAKAHFQSDKMLPRYGELLKRHVLDRYVARIAEPTDPEKAYDPNRDLLQSVEDRKNFYLRYGQVNRCMRSMLVETLGFHPRSKVCQKCSAREECLHKLLDFVEFDIVALRMGQISASEAMIQAKQRNRG